MSRLAAGLAAILLHCNKAAYYKLTMQATTAFQDALAQCARNRANYRQMSALNCQFLLVLRTQQQRWSPGQRHRARCRAKVQVKKVLHNPLK
jgi:hypothetical protein